MRRIDKPLLIAVVVLFLIGVVMVFSASSISAYMRFNTENSKFFVKQVIILFIGLIVALVVVKIPTQYYRKLSIAALFVLFLALLYLFVNGKITNNSKSWIYFPRFSFQPSEFVKIFSVIFMATTYDKYKNKLNKWNLAVFLPIIITIVVFTLIFFQPDLGTAVIYFLIMASLFLYSPVAKEVKSKTSMVMLLLILVVIFGVLSVGIENVISSDKLARLNPRGACSEEKFYTSGNQICNGYIAINNGGLFGVGLSKSTQKYLYLPEPHTDFIFTIIMEETGLAGATVILVLFLIVITRIIKIGERSNNYKGKLICFGFATYILVHIVINLGGVFGMFGMTGVPLPFMSYGGSFTLSLIMAIAVVQRINIENELSRATISKRKLKKK